MAFTENGFEFLTSLNLGSGKVAIYKSSADALATIKAANYFDAYLTRLELYDLVWVVGTDGGELVEVTSVTTHVEVGAATVATEIPLAQGLMLVGDATGLAETLDLSGAGNIGVGNGTTVAALDISAGGTIAVGNDTTAVALDASGDGYILVGDATDLNSVAVTGDIALSNAGVTTIQAGAVDEAMLAAGSLTGLVAANVADANVIGGIPVLHRINTAGGVTANTEVTLTHKTLITDVWVQNNGLGTASDTVQVFNVTNAITNAMDINAADESVVRAGTISDMYATIAAGTVLRVTETDGGGSDSPATTVYVLGVRVA